MKIIALQGAISTLLIAPWSAMIENRPRRERAADLDGPAILPTAPAVLLFGETPDSTCLEKAEAMLRTVPPQRLHEAIPAWRRLADSIRSLHSDERRMGELHQLIADERAGKVRFPDRETPAPDEFTAQLRGCDLRWDDVTGWSDRLQRALAIADSA